MIYTKEMSVGEIYENHPIGRDFMNILGGLGGKKYGFCRYPQVGEMSLEMIAQMLAHLVDEKSFDEMIELLNNNHMSRDISVVPAKEIWWKKAVFYQCGDRERDTMQKASELGADCVVVPWEICETCFTDRNVKELVSTVEQLDLKLLLNVDLCFSRYMKITGNEDIEAVKTEIMEKITTLLKLGVQGFVIRNADLLTADSIDEKISQQGRMAAFGDMGRFLFDTEMENFYRRLLELVENSHAVMIGETIFDGIAVNTARTLGCSRIFHLIRNKLDFDGNSVDFNDWKNWMYDRYEDIPEYWPVLCFETLHGNSTGDEVTVSIEVVKKVSMLLAVLHALLPGTMYVMDGEADAGPEFYRKLLGLRKEYQDAWSKTVQIKNKKLYDLMTFERQISDEETLYVECNLSKNDGILPYGRPENGELLLSNYQEGKSEEMFSVLRPFEVNVYRKKYKKTEFQK